MNLLIRNARIITLAMGAHPRRGKELGELFRHSSRGTCWCPTEPLPPWGRR